MLRPEILLHPNIPKPMHGLSPRTIMGDRWWNIERQKTYAKSYYHCVACDVSKWEAKYYQWLEAHELYEIDYVKGRMIFKEIVALCHSCHNFIHSGRMQALVDSGKMLRSKQQDILKHGMTIIEHHKLKKLNYFKQCPQF